jgi:uncharacterized protein (TIGR02594 family)
MPEKYLHIAQQELGVHETAGAEATARIIEYDKCTSLKACSDEVPWCSAFANWVVVGAGDRGTNSAAARSWLDWGRPIPDPVAGCIVVVDRKDPNNPNAAHVTFYVKDNGDGATFTALGGNQGDAVKYSNYRYDKVLGYREPKDGTT